MVSVVSGGHIDVCGLFCNLRPYWCLWSCCAQGTCGYMWLGCHQKPCRSPCSMVHAAADNKGQGSFFCSGIDDCRFTTESERHRRLCDNPLPNKETVWIGNTWCTLQSFFKKNSTSLFCSTNPAADGWDSSSFSSLMGNLALCLIFNFLKFWFFFYGYFMNLWRKPVELTDDKAIISLFEAKSQE